MKILSAEQVREADSFTIKNEPITSTNLMERASSACVKRIKELFDSSTRVYCFCGTANNGGDGLVVARQLIESGYQVTIIIVAFSNTFSEDNKINQDRLIKMNANVVLVKKPNDLPSIEPNSLLIDALIGTGLTRPLSGLLLETVQYMNTSKNTILAIDIPSGLYCDADCSNVQDGIIRACYTLTFEAPKLNFLLPENYIYVGKWEVLNIGLDRAFLKTLSSPYSYMEEKDNARLVEARSPFAHKGKFGHALVVAGSYGMVGAATLSSKACMRSGVGLTTAFIPKCGYEIVQRSVPEVMAQVSDSDNYISGEMNLNAYTAIGIGPGIGQNPKTESTITHILKNTSCPLVIDADALNCISKNKALLKAIPYESILTPHLKEFERLFGSCSSDYERLQKQRQVSRDFKVIIVLKGKHSSISYPDGSVVFNSSGNPGMATAGSGDVLTGILTGLLAQGYTPIKAATFGVFLHGLAGDLASNKMGEESMIASDIIEHIGAAYNSLK